MSIYFELDLSRCSACGACSVACMDQNDLDIKAGERPFRQVFKSEEGEDNKTIKYYSVACMHCKDATCVIACPSSCLYKDKETGLTLYDNTKCIGCHSCAMACPFGAPAFNKEGKMQKCDGCIERIKHGLIPACVRVCPTKALRLITDEKEQDQIKESLKKIGDQILDSYY